MAEVPADATPAPKDGVDPNVKIPPSVQAVIDRGAEVAKAVTAPVTPDPSPTPAPEPAAAPPSPPPEPAPPAVAGQPEPVGTADQERHRYLSMKGRYEAAQTSLGTAQQQLSEMADELIRAQNALAARAPAPAPAMPRAPALTSKDVETYGQELVDFARRAAQDAVAPEIQALREQNEALRQRLSTTASQTIYDKLDSDLPEWRQINNSPEFKRWCALRDVYSGMVRSRMLNDAFSRGQAARVVAFFRGFLSEAATSTPPVPQPQPAPQPARQPAIPLETLAAPGRDQPAGSSAPVGEKPVITRASIAAFYADVRKGAYRGRDAEKQAQERLIFAAQNEGRVSG